jgi:cell division protein FtsQ
MRLMPKAMSRRKSPNARRARKPRQRRQAIVAAAAVIAVSVGAGWHVSTSGWLTQAWQEAGARALRATAAAGLAVSEVVVEGRRHADRDDLQTAIGITRGMPILAVDPVAARARIEKLSWIRQATVVRRLPDIVYVRIDERVPLALWQQNGELRLVDRDGTVISANDLAPFNGLPLVVGDDAAQHASDLLELLWAFPQIAERTEAAIRVSGRRWNLRLANGIDVRLPESGVAAALGRLADAQRTQKLLERDVVAIDLRKPDRLIVRVSPEGRGRIGLDGKNT